MSGLGVTVADRQPFADNERFQIDEDGATQTWVVLATTERGGKEYALLANDAQLADDNDDMDVMIFALGRDEDGDKELLPVEDEKLYEALFAEFSETMGLEDSDEA